MPRNRAAPFSHQRSTLSCRFHPHFRVTQLNVGGHNIFDNTERSLVMIQGVVQNPKHSGREAFLAPSGFVKLHCSLGSQCTARAVCREQAVTSHGTDKQRSKHLHSDSRWLFALNCGVFTPEEVFCSYGTEWFSYGKTYFLRLFLNMH